jgi:hypothetical protein
MGFGEFIEAYGGNVQMVLTLAAALVIVGLIIAFVVNKGNVYGMPVVQLFKEGMSGSEVSASSVPGVSEGFYGGVARGAGVPDCLRTLTDAAEVYRTLAEACPESKDLAEMRLLLSKWGCLKKDLMGIQGVVEATRYQPYSTLHDRIPVADIAGQCKSKTMPQRDLDISLETWRERADFLLRRLAASVNLSQQEVARLEKLLASSWADLYNIAKSQCLTYIPSGELKLPRDAAPYLPDNLVDLGPYKGYF